MIHYSKYGTFPEKRIIEDAPEKQKVIVFLQDLKHKQLLNTKKQKIDRIIEHIESIL